ncbi:hypothetical protein ACNFJ7_07335 [Sphingomonas sp. HT-1]|jgi:hypothetical protein|uniref:hypothetical protein n=1 Tax=unclassified Sphingomonas TaxID=196159 RepID=UPI0002FB9315|nr:MULTISPECIES: hypothetical protein [unclassified Sphingomonas]KTF68409.1 hypothetical protein ATB93_13900 [Sphingomonas sp. WG]
MTRRPILWGTLAGLLLVALLAPLTGMAIGALSKARLEKAIVAGKAAAPIEAAAVMSPALAFPAAQAEAMIAARIERLARSGGVLVEAMAPANARPPLVIITLRLSGPEKAVVALADAIERERPVLRFRSWRMVPAEGGGVRLSAELIGAVR